jgi:hypothetical protein
LLAVFFFFFFFFFLCKKIWQCRFFFFFLLSHLPQLFLRTSNAPGSPGDAEFATDTLSVLETDPTAELVRFRTLSVTVRRTAIVRGEVDEEEAVLFLSSDRPHDAAVAADTTLELLESAGVDAVVRVAPRALRFMGISRAARRDDLLGDDVPPPTPSNQFRVLDVRGVPSAADELLGGAGPEIHPSFDRVLPDARVGDMRATWSDVRL